MDVSLHVRGPLTTKLYRAYVRTTMEYASPLWHGSINEEDALHLKRIPTAVACCILPAPQHTSKSQLLKILDWPSLFKVENNSFELTRIFKESFIDQRWAWEIKCKGGEER